jgi:hypothetical protein
MTAARLCCISQTDYRIRSLSADKDNCLQQAYVLVDRHSLLQCFEEALIFPHDNELIFLPTRSLINATESSVRKIARGAMPGLSGE